MKAVTFGEIMLRLKTPEYLRIVQAQNFEASQCGAEANVAAGLAMLKEEAALVTKLPDNPVGQAALNELRRYGTCLLYTSFHVKFVIVSEKRRSQ